MGIGNSQLSPCRGVRNHTMTDFIFFSQEANSQYFSNHLISSRETSIWPR